MVQLESLSEHDKTLTANQNPFVKEPGHLKRQTDRTTDLHLTEHYRQYRLTIVGENEPSERHFASDSN